MKISLILPIYNEQLELAEVLAKYVTDLKKIAADNDTEQSGKNKNAGAPKLTYEIIAVNDGSSDGSLKILTDAARMNRNIRVVNLDGRFGKQASIIAGMEQAKGDCVILADIELRNPVGILDRVYREFAAGNPIVYAYREKIGFNKLKEASSIWFTRFAAGLFGVTGKYTGRPHITLYSRSVTDVLISLPNKNKFLRTMDNWVDWDIAVVNYATEYNKREEKEKKKQAVAQVKSHGVITAPRDKVREHTASKIYARLVLMLAIVCVAVTVTLLFVANLPFGYYFFLIFLILTLLLISVILYARATLIKRVGVFYNNLTVEIYKIKNIIN